MTVLECIIMLSIDFLVYFTLTIYSENRRKLEYGTFRSLLFFMLPKYWKNRNRKTREHSIKNALFEKQDSIEMEQEIDCEPVSTDLTPAIILKDVEKTYYSNTSLTPIKAIKCLNLDIYSGQITAILGHNNSGKTTLLKILTSLTKLSKGTASIFSYDVSKKSDQNAIRKMTGVCSQQDRLYDLLTCYEHVELYARLKSVPKSMIKTKVEEILGQVELDDEKNTLAINLRIGQRRRLCLAVSLIGDPKVKNLFLQIIFLYNF